MNARSDVFGRGALCWPIEMPAQIRVCHIMSADLWAGAEVQLATTARYLTTRPEIAVSAVLLNEGRLARELKKLGIPVAVIDETHHSAAAILAILTRFLKAHRVDIVHTHRYKDTVLGTIAAKLAGVHHVVRTVHGLAEPMRGWDRVKFGIYETLDKAALWCFADRIVAVSKAMTDTLRASGYPRSTITPIHNGIDVDMIQATRDPVDVRRDLDIPAGALFIGTVGRMSPVKAQSVFLHAAQRILRTDERARFAIVGDGPLKRQLEVLAAQLGVDHACTFLESRADIHEIVGAMDIFVLPSLHEGIPMALLEAMSLAKPVVATAVGGIPEVVTDQVDGVLIPAQDDRALAKACLALAADPVRARAMGTAARATVAERFSSQRNGEALVDTYRTVADGAGKRTRTSGADLSAPALAWALLSGLVRVAAQRATIAFETAIEKRRMNRLRRCPAAVTTLLRSAKTILIVCQGNIIRSPFAAKLVREKLADAGNITVVSAGLAAVAGAPSHPIAFQLASVRSIDLSEHGASPMAPETAAASDIIFVMDLPQLVTMRRRFPEARSKTFLLTCLAPAAPLEIQDPFGGDESRFRACFDHIAEAVDPIVSSLRGTAI